MTDGSTVADYGTWASPLSAEAAASQATRFGALGLTSAAGRPVVLWSETRPDERGRTAIVAAVSPDRRCDVGSPSGSARSRVNEYGGGAMLALPAGDDRIQVISVDERGQRIQRSELVVDESGPSTSGRQSAVTESPPFATVVRHSLGSATADWLLVERERHLDDSEPVNEIVAVSYEHGASYVLVGDGDAGWGDFVASPQISPDGATLVWLRWDHPDMPWDAAELWAATVDSYQPTPNGSDTSGLRLVDARRIAGGRGVGPAGRPVAVCLPRWSPEGRLWWCDDSDDWWSLHASPTPGLPDEGAGDDPSTLVRVDDPDGPDSAVAADEAGEEVGEPRWVAGGSHYGFTSDGQILMVASRGGIDRLWLVDPATGARRVAPGPTFTSVENLVVEGHFAAVIGGDSLTPNTVWLIDLASGEATDLRPVPAPVPPEWVSTPRSVSFPTGPQLGTGAAADGPVAHALFYPPTSGDHRAPEGTQPPLVVRIHGGPTAAARPEFSTSVQFWTTRGFAVADINYRGSVGFGRPYRDALNGQWGVADVQDCISLARYLAAEGMVDGDRCVIRGGSAGGFTALAAVCFQAAWGAPDTFAAACSLYGVTDLAALAADTHKFESRYLDGLVAPLPAGAEVYRERSPLHHASNLTTPVLLLQGSEDRIVPPAQAEVLVDALRANGVRHEYVLFAGEGHGFVRSETVVRALHAELEFYTEVLRH